MSERRSSTSSPSLRKKSRSSLRSSRSVADIQRKRKTVMSTVKRMFGE